MFEASCEFIAVPRTDQQRVPAQDRQGKRRTGHRSRHEAGDHGVGMKLRVKVAVHVVPEGCGHHAGCRYQAGSACSLHPDRDEQQSLLHAEQGCADSLVVVAHDPRVFTEKCRKRHRLGRGEGDVNSGRAVIGTGRIQQDGRERFRIDVRSEIQGFATTAVPAARTVVDGVVGPVQPVARIVRDGRTGRPRVVTVATTGVYRDRERDLVRVRKCLERPRMCADTTCRISNNGTTLHHALPAGHHPTLRQSTRGAPAPVPQHCRQADAVCVFSRKPRGACGMNPRTCLFLECADHCAHVGRPG